LNGYSEIDQKVMDPKELQAMINLLEDPNQDVFKMVYNSLLEKGPEIIPELEKAWENSQNELSQDRLEDLIQKIHMNVVEKDIISWIRSDNSEILRGAYLIARLQYPDLNYSDINEPVEKIKNDVWLELNNNLTALEKIRILNHIIFNVYKYSRNSANPVNPQNSFINQVIETKKGNSYSISIIYLAVAQKLNLPVRGVDLPKNMILAYMDLADQAAVPEHQDYNVLFYINPFNKGAVLGKREIEYFLRQYQIEPSESFFKPCSNRIIIERMVVTLIDSYRSLGYQDKIRQMERILAIFHADR
jgi:regulator of sirC expression with transglutaminase-like and TPR domain